MFWFGTKKPAPPLSPSNPGVGVEAKVAFTTGDRSWVEKVNVVSVAASVFIQHRHRVTNEKFWLHHFDSGFFAILPQLVGLQPLGNGGVQTTTTIQINHPKLIPDEVFEYQHSTGDSVADSLSKGFDQWVQTDFVTLLESQRSKPDSCTTLKIAFPAKEGKLARSRRAVLGPVAHLVESRPRQPVTPPQTSIRSARAAC
jgi:hypothetical protein